MISCQNGIGNKQIKDGNVSTIVRPHLELKVHLNVLLKFTDTVTFEEKCNYVRRALPVVTLMLIPIMIVTKKPIIPKYR